VLPDGAVHLIFHFGDAATGTAVVAGPTTAPALLRFCGRVEGLSVTLRPGAVAALLGLPAGEIAGTVVGLDTLWGPDGASLVSRMNEAPDDIARSALLQAALRTRVRNNAGPVPVSHAARLIAESGGQRALRDVAAALGVGERRLQQLFHAEVGLSPRSWSRLARLHACLRALRQPATPRWAELAVDAGYYDQSHLANEFQALCGLSPSLFLAQTASDFSKT
jgi:AraC-like DNA-binding protein